VNTDRVKGITLDVELLGVVREVKFVENMGVQISSMSYGDFEAMLDKLALGTVLSAPTAPPAPLRGDAIPASTRTPPASPPKAPEEAPARRTRPRAVEPDAPAQAPATTQAASQDAPVQEEAPARPLAGTKQMTIQDESKPETVKAQAPVATPAPSGDIAPELSAAVKIREVVEFLLSKGFDTKDKLIAECTRIQQDVPVLKRISNLPARIEQAAEIYGAA
jgi:hypothetical protein